MPLPWAHSIMSTFNPTLPAKVVISLLRFSVIKLRFPMQLQRWIPQGSCNRFLVYHCWTTAVEVGQAPWCFRSSIAFLNFCSSTHLLVTRMGRASLCHSRSIGELPWAKYTTWYFVDMHDLVHSSGTADSIYFIPYNNSVIAQEEIPASSTYTLSWQVSSLSECMCRMWGSCIHIRIQFELVEVARLFLIWLGSEAMTTQERLI